MQVKFWPHDGAIWKKLDDYRSHSNSSWGKTACLNYIFVYYIFNKSINIQCKIKECLRHFSRPSERHIINLKCTYRNCVWDVANNNRAVVGWAMFATSDKLFCSCEKIKHLFCIFHKIKWSVKGTPFFYYLLVQPSKCIAVVRVKQKKIGLSQQLIFSVLFTRLETVDLPPRYLSPRSFQSWKLNWKAF